jgi:hypothetical protein
VIRPRAHGNRASRRPLALRLAAGLAALLLVGGQGLSALHHALVAHRVCAEHGEWIHGAEHAADGATSAARSREVRAADGAGESHEHCAVLGRVDGHRAAVAPGVAVAAPPDVPAAPPAVVARSPWPGALLLIAPKTSPPA